MVLVTAPLKVLEARLANRDRASDGPVSRRLARSSAIGACLDADVVVRNVGRLEVAVRRLLNVIRDSGYFILY